jgi:surface polysaccharide O-acyltransferase-like enzyme
MSAATTAVQSRSSHSNKLFYIDNIRVLLTILVVLHHTFITYGAPGGWYYTQKTTHLAALFPMTLFVSVNQSFFMGFFFLLSAYFTGPSYDRKGAARFIADRLIRLGIPLLFYSFVFSPFLSYLVYYFAKGQHITYLQYLSVFNDWIDFGVMWFVAALLVFTLVYVAMRKLITTTFKNNLPAPGAGAILLFCCITGRYKLFNQDYISGRVGASTGGVSVGPFYTYIALYIIGLVAYRNKWFDALSDRTGKRLTLSAWLCLLFFPVFFLIKVKFDMPIAWYSGGFHWQSLLYAVWEQWIGLSILTALLVWGKRSWNKSSALLDRLSRSAFAVYIFHPLVIIGLSLSVRNQAVDPAIKLLLVAPLAVLGSFLLGPVILLIPGVKKIL